MTSYGSLMTAGYRSDNLRAWKQSNGTRTYYYYGGGQLLFEASNGYITARNVFGPDGLVARTGSGGTWVCYTFDQQGNVTHRTDPSGNVLGTYGSDAYGNPTSWANSTAPYDYNGQWGYYKDVETGLYYCQNRYYDPVNGRWLTQDPIGMDGGLNLYGYCGGSPVNAKDPVGLERILILIGQGIGSEKEPTFCDGDIFFAHMISLNHPDDDVDIMEVESLEDAYKAISKADSVVIIAHGRDGRIRLGRREDPIGMGKLTISLLDILGARKGRKLSQLKLFSCNIANSSESQRRLRTVAKHGFAYSFKKFYEGEYIRRVPGSGPNFRW